MQEAVRTADIAATESALGYGQPYLTHRWTCTHVLAEQPSGRLVVVNAARSETPLGCRAGDGERTAGEGGSEQSGGHGCDWV